MITTIELHQSNFKFSAGHFTIFSATEREFLHGHNFTVAASITTKVEHNGMAFDYDEYKSKIRLLCKKLGHVFLLAGRSPYCEIKEDNEHYYVYFNNEKIPFLKKDALILPLENITIEELAAWFLQQLIEDKSTLKQHKIRKFCIKVFSAPGQSASAQWVDSD